MDTDILSNPPQRLRQSMDLHPAFPSLRPYTPPQNAAWQRHFLLRRRTAEVAVTPANRGVRSAKAARVEAALFVANGALTLRKLAQFALLADVEEARQLIDELNTLYDEQGTAFRIEQVATGFQILTRAEYVSWLDRIHHRQERQKLSSAASETLAIIAYRQPVTRADVEAVRGVQSAEMIKQLLDRGLVRVAGEDDSLGRPFLYGTTKTFLEAFGLQSLSELPMGEDLRRVAPDDAEEDIVTL